MKKIFVLASLLAASSTYAIGEELNIGILVPSKVNFKEEVDLSRDEFSDIFGESISPLVAQYSDIGDIKGRYDSLKKNSDIILSLDPVSTSFLKRNKLEFFSPYTTNLSGALDSASVFRDIFPFKSITLVTTRDVYINDILSNIDLGLESISTVFIEDEPTITTDAILVYNPTKRNSEKFNTLISNNLDRGVPSFSLMNRDYVYNGAIAGIDIEKEIPRLIREIALDLEEGSLTPSSDYLLKGKLTINLSSLKKVGVFPSRDIIESSTLIGSLLDGGEKVTFKGAIDDALNKNLNLKSKTKELEALSLNPKRVKSNNRPQINAFTNYTNLNDTYTSISPLDSENTLRGGVRVSQNIFNDDLSRDIYISEKTYDAKKESYERDRADTTYLAGAAYLRILNSKASLNISEYNLNLTSEFLDIAKNRKDIGISDSSDTFRLESLYAKSLTSISEGRAELSNSRKALNQLLNAPLDRQLDLSNTDINSDLFLSSVDGFDSILENPIKLDKFIGAYTDINIEEVPEIKAISHLIKSKEREVKVASRRRFTPSIALEAESSWDLADPWGENDHGKTKEDYWQLGIGFNLPLYSGGDIELEKDQVNYELDSLVKQKEAIVEEYTRIFSDKITNLSAAYEGINNARESVIASEKNLDLVMDNYAKGSVSITNLLDAQTDALNSKEKEVMTNYRFLVLLLDLERSSGKYFFSDDNSNKNNLIDRINDINSIKGEM